MTGGESVALAVALLVPVAGAAATLTRRPSADRAVGASTVVCALAWALLLATGARGRLSVFHVSPLVAAGGCGAALLVAAALDGGRRDPRAVTGTVLALVAVTAGLAGGGESGQVVVAGAMVAGLALAAVVSVDALPPAERRLAVPLSAAGLGAAVVGFAVLRETGERWSLPSTGTVPRGAIIAFLVAGAVLVVAGTLKGRRPTGVLLAAGLVLGLAAGPLRPADDLAAVAIALAALAVGAGATGRGPAALGLLALAAAAGPSALVPASRLLAAGSVVAAALDRPAAWLAAVPGAVALAAGVVEDGGPLAGTLAVAAGLVAAGLAVAATVPPRAKEPPATAKRTSWASPGVVPAVVTGAWLSLAPGTWTWTGAALDAYDRGAVLAVAAGLVTVGAAVAAPRLRGSAGPAGPTPLPGPRLRPSLDRLRPVTRRPPRWRPAPRSRSPWPRRPWSTGSGRPRPPRRR